MGEHSVDDRDPNNTPDANDKLVEHLTTEEYGDIITALVRGDGVAHTSPPPGWTGKVVVHPDDRAEADDGERPMWWEYPIQGSGS